MKAAWLPLLLLLAAPVTAQAPPDTAAPAAASTTSGSDTAPSLPATGTTPPGQPDWNALGDEAVSLLQQLIRIDTTNPPGNEVEAARFVKQVLDREGIEARVLESAPGRGNVYARLKGDGTRKALVLLSHLDVVPADRRYWSTDPFSGEVRDGYVWGRGALDMKGTASVHLATLLALKRAGTPLKRDVILLGTADEESGGGQGLGWLLREHFDLVADAEFVLSEGNAIFVGDGYRHYYVAASEKGPLWLRLTARGTPGHGSQPRGDSAVDKLLAALQRIRAYQTPLKVVPPVQSFWAALAADAPGPAMAPYRDLAASLATPGFATTFTKSPNSNAQVRNTIAVTMLEGSSKVNVIPAEASAQLDVRLLPGESSEAFLTELRGVIADPDVTVEPTLSFGGSESPTDTEVVRVIRDFAAVEHPGALVAFPMLVVFTDCRHFRGRGIPCYGFTPIEHRSGDMGGVHGNDERVGVENVKSATRRMYEIVRRLTAE